MDELRARYERQSKAYDELVNTTLAKPETVSNNVRDITALAGEMGKTLDEMIALIVQTNGATQTQRDELVQKLTKIQRDYNGLVQNTDKLETLRRIRAFEDTSWKRTLYIWITAFCVVVLLVVVFIFLRKKPQDIASAPIIPSSPTTMAPLA